MPANFNAHYPPIGKDDDANDNRLTSFVPYLYTYPVISRSLQPALVD